MQRVGRALALTLGAALLTLPFAAAWGIGHARIDDYLGPHRATFAANALAVAFAAISPAR